jgi:hypothetical protein
VWWHTPVIPAAGRLRQEDLELEASLGCIEGSCQGKKEKKGGREKERERKERRKEGRGEGGNQTPE